MDAANICDVFCVANAAANSDAERRHRAICPSHNKSGVFLPHEPKNSTVARSGLLCPHSFCEGIPVLNSLDCDCALLNVRRWQKGLRTRECKPF
jgi:hypothetical protein